MAAWARWPSASSQVPKRERLRLQVPIKRVLLSYPTGDADNSRSNRARRSLNKHGTPFSADVLRRECKGRQSKSNTCKMRSPCWRRLDCCVFSSYLDAESSRSSKRHSDGALRSRERPDWPRVLACAVQGAL